MSVFVAADDGLPKQLLPVLKVYKNRLKAILISEDKDKEETAEADENLDLANRVLTPTLINAISTIILALPTDDDLTIKVSERILYFNLDFE